jgi:hypothetical protein
VSSGSSWANPIQPRLSNVGAGTIDGVVCGVLCWVLARHLCALLTGLWAVRVCVVLCTVAYGRTAAAAAPPRAGLNAARCRWGGPRPGWVERWKWRLCDVHSEPTTNQKKKSHTQNKNYIAVCKSNREKRDVKMQGRRQSAG